MAATQNPAVGLPNVSTPADAQGWLTTPDHARFAQRLDPHAITDHPSPGGINLRIDPSRRYQRIVGFGAALTASSAQLLHRLPTVQQTAALDTLFRPGTGAGITVLRVVIGASDFAPNAYTYDDLPPGQTDPTLAQFSIAHDRATILPILRQALAINPRLTILATPWSAPAWMKTTGSLNGGTLARANYGAYAKYFVRFVKAYAAAGVPVTAISVQNEPQHTASDYPTMSLTAEQETAFVADYLGPAMAHADLARVKIIGYDQNWAKTSYPIKLLHSAASPYVYGTAFHCYAGAPTAQTTVHNAAPQKAIWFTECSGGGWAPNYASNLGWNTHKLLIGALRNWAQTILYWNIALAPNGGPHHGGCADCRGVLTIGANDTVTKNVEFAELAQASSAAPAGAIRVQSPASVRGIETVAFVNPNRSRAIIIDNTQRQSRTVNVTDGSGKHVSAVVPGGATLSLRWSDAGPTGGAS